MDVENVQDVAKGWERRQGGRHGAATAFEAPTPPLLFDPLDLDPRGWSYSTYSSSSPSRPPSSLVKPGEGGVEGAGRHTGRTCARSEGASAYCGKKGYWKIAADRAMGVWVGGGNEGIARDRHRLWDDLMSNRS